MLEISHGWTSTGSSGGLEPVLLRFGCMDSVLNIRYSTLASTQSISFQTAPESTGPWVIEAMSSQSTAASTAINIRITGSYEWMRPYLHSNSTGTYHLKLVAGS